MSKWHLPLLPELPARACPRHRLKMPVHTRSCAVPLPQMTEVNHSMKLTFKLENLQTMPQRQSLHNGDQHPHHNLQTHTPRFPDAAVGSYTSVQLASMSCQHGAHHCLAHLHMPGASIAAFVLGAACTLQKRTHNIVAVPFDVSDCIWNLAWAGTHG